MNDTPERLALLLRDNLGNPVPTAQWDINDYRDVLERVVADRDALAADLARVVAYARELEEIVEDAQRDNRMIDDVANIRSEHGVADLMRDNGKEAR